jgi:hypothetical protein
MDMVAYRPPGFARALITHIPPGHYWLAGDNASNSTDSRSYGPVPQELIQGRVVCKFSLSYPFIQMLDREIPGLEKETENFITDTPMDKLIRENVKNSLAGKEPIVNEKLDRKKIEEIVKDEEKVLEKDIRKVSPIAALESAKKEK